MGTSKSPFSMYARKRKHGKPVYYVRFRNLDGTLSSAKCSGETSKGAAKNWAVGEIETGHIPPAAGNSPTLNQWATGFFGKGGRYDDARRARGKVLSTTYLTNCDGALHKHILPVFGHKKLDRIRTEELDRFFLKLYNSSGLSGSTVNNILKAVRDLFREARRLGVISENPAQNVTPFSDAGSIRGALTQGELDRLFAFDALESVWGGRRVTFLVSLIAAGCGLRHGEILALRPCDIGDGVLRVTRSWDRVARHFVPPKWNSIREVPAPPRVQMEIDVYVQMSRMSRDALLFPSGDHRQPMDPKENVEALRNALEQIGIRRVEQSRSIRFLDIHALRHSYISRLRADDVPDWQIQRAAGHRSLEMTDRYTHTRGTDLGAIVGAGTKILPFSRAAGSE